MQILHLDLKPVEENYAELRYFFDNANQYQRRSLPLEAIAEVIELAETAYYSPHESIILRSRLSVYDYTITGRKLFNWLDGSDRFLQQAINQYWQEGIVLAIAASAKLAHLPWELLHDGNNFLVARMPAVVPVRWVSSDTKKLSIEGEPANRALNVLFMATSPLGVEPVLDFEAEEGRILEATARAKIGLTVEESGCLTELGYLVADYDRGVRGEQNTVAEILARLEADPVELREQVLAEALLAQIDRTLEEMLQRGLVFELPVPKEAIAAVCESIPNLEQQINRAVALGLLEVSPDESLRVPRILPLKLPEDAEALYKQGAEVLYRLWWEEAETSTEEQRLEIHCLALRGKVETVAIAMAATLAELWANQGRYRQAVELCKATLEIAEDYRVLHGLARSEQELGEVSQAQTHYQQALDSCPQDNEKEKAVIIHHLAILKANTGQIEEAIALFQQSLEIKERIGDAQDKAMTLWWLGHIAEQQGDSATALHYLQQSLEILQRLQSPDAETVREVIDQVQQMAEKRG